MQLSQEHFDKSIAPVLEKLGLIDIINSRLTKVEFTLNKVESRVDNIEDKISRIESQMGGMATKEDLKDLSKELKEYTHQDFETQQEYIDHRFEELIEARWNILKKLF